MAYAYEKQEVPQIIIPQYVDGSCLFESNRITAPLFNEALKIGTNVVIIQGC